jgi:hypothetical protein
VPVVADVLFSSECGIIAEVEHTDWIQKLGSRLPDRGQRFDAQVVALISKASHPSSSNSNSTKITRWQGHR